MAKILIVDDSVFMISVIKNFALKSGRAFDVIEAHNGDEAIEKYRKERPDLVFMDIKMDGMDGLTALQEINRHGAAKVVMCTSLKEPELEAKAKAAGAVGYLLKPFQSDDIVAEIEKHLPRTL